MTWSELARLGASSAWWLVGRAVGRAIGRAIGRRSRPLVGGIALGDSCNLSCLQCSVSNRGIADLTYAEIRTGLGSLRRLGARLLYVEGGEPYLWRDGRYELDDVVRLARELGFLAVVVYTNGTFPLHTSADAVFVSVDGTRETNDSLRGKSFDRVMETLRTTRHPNVMINCTINRVNIGEIGPISELARDLPTVRGVAFYCYTPGGSHPELMLRPREKRLAMTRLLELKRAGLPVLNSRASLRRVRDDTWRRPTDSCYLYADRAMYRCCRLIDSPEACRECGYLGYAELDCIARLQPDAIYEAFHAMAGHR